MFGVSSRLTTAQAVGTWRTCWLKSYRAMATTTTTASDASTARVIKGIVFDMDGTLTVPVIDFAEMRRRVAAAVGAPDVSGDILDFIKQYPEPVQAVAYAEIKAVETVALANMQVMPGALDLAAALDSAGIPRALVTRNVSSSVEFFHKTHFALPPFYPALSREFEPWKPHPGALLHIASHWGIEPQELLMIGDSPKDDIVCGNRAGAATCMLDTEQRFGGLADFKGEERPDFFVRSLTEFLEEVLQSGRVRLQPPDQLPVAQAQA